MTRRAEFAHYSHVARCIYRTSACCITNCVALEYCMRKFQNAKLQSVAASVTLILNINCSFWAG